MTSHYIEKIENAAVYDVAIKSPVDEANLMSARLGNTVLLKREDLQPVFSFKLRGAYNKMVGLSSEERARGVITASAGNHAQGVALAGTRLGIKATIVMPETTPQIKVDAVKARGGHVVLHGDTYDEASVFAKKQAAEQGLCYIHPYDDPDVIAGQGTIGKEILEQVDNLDAIFVPVGGGGLMAGVAVWVKAKKPAVKIIAVEPEDAACLKAAMEAGERVVLSSVGIFADGVAVAQIGEEPFRVAQLLIDEVITANTDEICAAIKDIFDDTRSIAEPAGALALAGLKKYVELHNIKDQTLLAIESGANTNFDRLRYISERTEIGEKREAILAVTIPERPGSFLEFCQAIGKRNVTEFNYRYAESDQAHIFVGIQTAIGAHDRYDLVKALEDKGYPVADMTDNEVAKLHVRFMVGGHAASKVENELVYRFEFPERPGALMKFLQHLGKQWNISMFHYRNHGAAFGRVLVGLQVPEDERDKLDDFLNELAYGYTEETENLAYKLFLGR